MQLGYLQRGQRQAQSRYRIQPDPPAGSPRPRRRQTVEAAGRQQSERYIDKIHLPPAGVDIGTQQHHRQCRQQKASQQQETEPQPGVAQNRPGPGQPPDRQRRNAHYAQQQNERRRGNKKPGRQVMRRRQVAQQGFPLKHRVNPGRMIGPHPQRMN